MSTRAKPFVLNLGNAPRDAAARRPSPEAEPATEPSRRPGGVKIGEREYEIRALTVAAKKVDHRVVRRYPAPSRRVVSAAMGGLTPIPAPIPIVRPTPIRLAPFAPIPVTRPAPIPITPSRGLVPEPQPPLEAE